MSLFSAFWCKHSIRYFKASQEWGPSVLSRKALIRMSVNELSFILAKHDNVPSASNIPSRIHHNCGAQPPPEHTTSASFLASHSTPATATNLPRYPLQAHVNNRDYPPPQVVDTTLAPNFTDAGPGSPRTHIATGEGSTLNVVCTFSSSVPLVSNHIRYRCQ